MTGCMKQAKYPEECNKIMKLLRECIQQKKEILIEKYK